MFRTNLLILVLAISLPLTACGKRSGDSATEFSIGAIEYALPFLPVPPSIEAPTYGFKNLTSIDVTISVTGFTLAGTPYPAGPVPVLIPALGETRVSLGTLLGGPSSGGWVLVDTTGPAAGLVVPYVDRVILGGRASAEMGNAFRAGTIYSSISPFATSYQVINNSKSAGGVPIAATYDLTMYAADGTVSSTMPGVVFGPHAAMTYSVTPGTIGSVSATPISAPPMPLTTISVREGTLPVHTEYRLHHDVDTRLDDISYGIDLEFGRDSVGAGNVHDFGVMVSNTSTSIQTLVLNSIYRSNGTAILGTPRFVNIPAMATKFLATRTIDSLGLEIGEVSPFADLFGDVAVAPSVTTFSMFVTAPIELDVSARHYDRLFGSYHRIVTPRRLTTNVSTSNIPVQTTTAGAIRTYIDLMNPTAFEQTVFVRGFTPGGTEYVIDSMTVAAFRRVRWSPDGTIFREDPFDTLLPAVPFMSFEFSSTGGMHYGARTEVRDVLSIFSNMVPIIVRDLAFE